MTNYNSSQYSYYNCVEPDMILYNEIKDNANVPSWIKWVYLHPQIALTENTK